MHTGPSESTILRGILEKEIKERTALQEKLNGLLGDLEYVECDISKDRTWADQYFCGCHGTWFKDKSKGEVVFCPVGDFARELKKQNE